MCDGRYYLPLSNENNDNKKQSRLPLQAIPEEVIPYPTIVNIYKSQMAHLYMPELFCLRIYSPGKQAIAQ